MCAKVLGFSLLLFPPPKFLGAMLRWKLRPFGSGSDKTQKLRRDAVWPQLAAGLHRAAPLGFEPLSVKRLDSIETSFPTRLASCQLQAILQP